MGGKARGGASSVCREDGEGRIPRGGFHALRFVLFVVECTFEYIYETSARLTAIIWSAAPRVRPSSSLVDYHRFPPISLASFFRSSAELFPVLSDVAAVLKAATPKTRLNRLLVFLFGPADCDP